MFGYRFAANSAIAEDVDTTKGTAIPAIQTYIDFLNKDSVKNAKLLLQPYYYLTYYYHDVTKDYPKSLEILNHILAVNPEDKYALSAKPTVEKEIANPAPAAKGSTNKGSTGSTPAPKKNK